MGDISAPETYGSTWSSAGVALLQERAAVCAAQGVSQISRAVEQRAGSPSA